MKKLSGNPPAWINEYIERRPHYDKRYVVLTGVDASIHEIAVSFPTNIVTIDLFQSADGIYDKKTGKFVPTDAVFSKAPDVLMNHMRLPAGTLYVAVFGLKIPSLRYKKRVPIKTSGTALIALYGAGSDGIIDVAHRTWVLREAENVRS
jgi:hypothetical protein